MSREVMRREAQGVAHSGMLASPNTGSMVMPPGTAGSGSTSSSSESRWHQRVWVSGGVSAPGAGSAAGQRRPAACLGPVHGPPPTRLAGGHQAHPAKQYATVPHRRHLAVLLPLAHHNQQVVDEDADLGEGGREGGREARSCPGTRHPLGSAGGRKRGMGRMAVGPGTPGVPACLPACLPCLLAGGASPRGTAGRAGRCAAGSGGCPGCAPPGRWTTGLTG